MNPAYTTSPAVCRKIVRHCVCVFAAAALASLGASAQQINTPAAPANDNGDETVILSAFTVTSARDMGYRASNSISGTRLNQKIENIAQNISVVTEDFIKDIGAIELNEAVRYITGVTQDSYTNESSFTVRGYNALRPLRNGVTTSGELPTDTATIERVEIVKGPSAVLYGVSSPGGVINYITKQPDHDRRFAKVDFTMGSFGRYRVQGDYNQPLGTTSPLAVRLIAAYDTDTGYIGTGRNRYIIAPSISWRINKTTYFSVNFERIHQKINRVGPGILTPDGKAYAAFPRFLNLMGPDQRTSDITFINGFLRTQLGEHWTIKLSGNFHNNPQDFWTFTPGSKVQLDGTRQYLSMHPNRRGTDFPNYEGQIEAVAQYEFFGVKSTTLIGSEYLYNRLDQWYIDAPTSENSKWYVDDPSTWTYGKFWDPSIYNTISTTTTGGYLNRYQHFWGAYVDEQISFWHDRVRLSAGVRRDEFHLRFYYPKMLPESKRNVTLETNAYNPKFGALVTVFPGVNLYAIASASFQPNNQVDKDGNAIKPQRGHGLEGGVKLNFMGGRLSMTGSVYQIKLNNLAQAIPGTSPQEWATLGEQTVKGAEAQVFYTPIAPWDIIASYSYNDGYVSNDLTKSNIGNPLQALPHNMASFWNRYTFKSGPLKNLRFGVGFTYRGPMRDRIEAVRRYCAENGKTHSIMGWVEGPGAEAADVRGVENFFIDLLTDPETTGKLMDVCVDVAIPFAKIQVDLGADTIGIGDAVASQVSWPAYSEHILPREIRLVSALKAMGAKVRLHICGNITHILPGIAQLGIDVLDVDHMVDLRTVRKIVGPRVAIGGNLDPVRDILRGTPETIRAASRRAYAESGNPFMVNAGCEIPSGTPVENLRALCEPLEWLQANG